MVVDVDLKGNVQAPRGVEMQPPHGGKYILQRTSSHKESGETPAEGVGQSIQALTLGEVTNPPHTGWYRGCKLLQGEKYNLGT